GLLPSRMLSTDSYSALLERGRNAGADFAEVYVERWRRRALRTIDGRVEEATSGIQLGAGIRLFFGEDVIYGYTNDLTDAALAELVTSLAGLRGGAAGRPDSAGRGGIDLRKLDGGPSIHDPKVPFETHDKLWRLARLRELEAGAR